LLYATPAPNRSIISEMGVVMENLNSISALGRDSAADQGARPVSDHGSALYSPKIGPELRRQLDEARNTRARFDRLRSPAFHLEQKIAELTGLLECAAKRNEALTTTISELRSRLILYEDPATTGRVSIKSIQMAVAEHYGLGLTEMLSARRTGAVVGPRQIAMYLAKIRTTASYPEIGRCFGNRDHTTVLHACRTVTSKFEDHPDLKVAVDLLRDKLLSASVA
jgi:chromosomal replication initiation ATPase DnaA